MSATTGYTPSELVQHLGSATEIETGLEREGFTNDAFIVKGRQIGLPRLIKDDALDKDTLTKTPAVEHILHTLKQLIAKREFLFANQPNLQVAI